MKKVVGFFSVLLLVITAVIVSSVIINHNRLQFLAVAADKDSLIVAEGSGKMILFHRMDLKTGSVKTGISASSQTKSKVQLDSLTPYEAEVSWVFRDDDYININTKKIQLRSPARLQVSEKEVVFVDGLYGDKVVSFQKIEDGTLRFAGYRGMGKFSHPVDLARSDPYLFLADRGGIFSKGGIYGLSPGDPYWRRIAAF